MAEGVPTFGIGAKTDSQLILEMLAKVRRLNPAKFGSEKSQASSQGTAASRAPPGLECYGPAPLTDEDLSTTDEGFASSDQISDVEEVVSHSPSGMSSLASKTTLMVRNVPVMYTQDLLMEQWTGPWQFDFFYLPRTAGGKTNLSYAFINFLTEEDAMRFQAAWHKQRLPHFTARKPVNVSFAEIQGLSANIHQLRKKRSRSANEHQCEPLVLMGRQFVPLSHLPVMDF